MSKSLLKQMLNSLINEDKESASSYFHDYLTLKAKNSTGSTVKEDYSAGIYPRNMADARKLVALFKNPIKAEDARDQVFDLVYSDDLDEEIARIEERNPNKDVRINISRALNEIVGNSDIDQDGEVFELFYNEIFEKF